MLIRVANLITLSAYTHIYSNNISSNPICLLAPRLHAWPNCESSCSCCFSSCSLPQRLVAIWPAWSCYWNLGVVSLLLVSLSLNLLLSPCVPPRPLFFTLCFFLGKPSFGARAVVSSAAWGEPALATAGSGRFCGEARPVGASVESTSLIACDWQCFCSPSKKDQKCWQQPRFWGKSVLFA